MYKLGLLLLSMYGTLFPSNHLHIVCGEESIGAIQLSGPSPPAWVQLLDVCDDFVNVKRQLTVILCVGGGRSTQRGGVTERGGWDREREREGTEHRYAESSLCETPAADPG